MFLLLGTFDVHRRDWRALVRRMRLLRLSLKLKKTLVLQTKPPKTRELRAKEQYPPPLRHSKNKQCLCGFLCLATSFIVFSISF